MFKGKRKEHIVGDIMTVEFIKNQKKGRKPICLIGGKVAFINRTFREGFIQEHSLWQVELDEIHDRHYIVTPIQICKSAAENQKDISERMQELATKHTPERRKRK